MECKTKWLTGTLIKVNKVLAGKFAVVLAQAESYSSCTYCSGSECGAMGSKVLLKSEHKNWREIKLQKRKWKEEKLMKKLRKLETEEEETKQEEVEVREEQVKPISTCSIAVPGSILQNAQSHELRTYLAGQVARAACIYKVNEIIIFDDEGDEPPPVVIENPVLKTKKSCAQFARLLQYLECPQYLRKYFFPLHNDLQYAGLMNPLDAPHHLRQDDEFQFREGITTDKPVKKGKGTYVYVGLLKQVLIDKTLQPNLRVTVQINASKKPESKKLKGIVVSPDMPLKCSNTYWGYSVRIAHSISEVFSKCPYKEGYDLTIGTSDKGKNVSELKKGGPRNYKHCLIVFGGLQGLESALENDSSIEEDDVALLFDFYLNTCPGQGSRTIRTEEAILITLAELRETLFPDNN